MPLVDVIDETFVVAPPPLVAAAVKEPEFWARVFPGLELTVFEDRGDDGIRLTVTGALVGTNEFWVEPWGDGAIVHYYLRADPTRRGSDTEPVTGDPRRLRRLAVRVRTEHCVRLKAGLNEVKDRLEAGRPPGTPPPWAVAPAVRPAEPAEPGARAAGPGERARPAARRGAARAPRRRTGGHAG